MDEIRKIIDEYQAEIEEAGSENERRSAMEYAFNRIVEIVKAEKKATAGFPNVMLTRNDPDDNEKSLDTLQDIMEKGRWR